MKTIQFISLSICLQCCSMLFTGCGGVSDSDRHAIDSLNTLASRMKYISLDSSLECSDEILNSYQESGYSDGLYEAMLNKGSAYGLQMNYDSAQYYYKKVLEDTDNDLIKSVADVDMMSLCLMTSQSKEFYDYRSDAHERFANVEEEIANMDDHQKAMWNSVIGKYHFVSLNYFLKTRQGEGIREEYDWLEKNKKLFATDSTLLAQYLFLKSVHGQWGENENRDADEQWYNQIGLISLCKMKGYVYFEILAVNNLAKSILWNGELKPSQRVLVEEIFGFENGADLSHALANHGLILAKQYGNDYLTGMILITLSDYYLKQGEYEAALMQTEEALQLINAQHKRQYGAAEGYANDILYTYSEAADTLSTELKWIADPNVTAVPEWMALVREQLSVVYGAMGMKEQSDYNHNIYFDMLDATRQDLRVQQEEENLQEEERWLNLLLYLFIFSIIVLIWMFVFFNKKSKREYKAKVEKLGDVVSICKKMPAALMEDIEDEDDLDKALHSIVNQDIAKVFPQLKDVDWTKAEYKSVKGLDGEMLHVLQVFYKWVREKGFQMIGFMTKKEHLEVKTYASQKRLEENKREYLEKLTSLSIINGMTPFMNRALHEVYKLKNVSESEATVRERIIYLNELIDKINEYNDVLGHWVKIRQGMLALNIEHFALQPLFDTLQHGSKAFVAKDIVLTIKPSGGIVRADRALTLFMMNTLLDNARKYTPQGGSVTLEANDNDGYVEISVVDTGYGMSAKDVATLNNSKVYDSSHIGEGEQHAEDIKRNKGFGFGLMNCKGIIEKYRKTGSVFSVCEFGVESEVGKGSRVYFRLPKGLMKNMCAILMFTLGLQTVWASDYLKQAENYTDSVLEANIERQYNKAISFADSAIYCFNRHYLSGHGDNENLMSLQGNSMAELSWIQHGFNTNYEAIIMLRNEVAIAALSLNENKLYHYNNELFTQLYTLTSTDPTLEEYCNSIKSANRNKKTILILLGTLICFAVVYYYFLHYRHYQLFTFNLRQFVRLNNNIFTSSEASLMEDFSKNLSDIKQVDTVGLMVPSDGGANSFQFKFAGDDTKRNLYESLMLSAYKQNREFGSDKDLFHAYPLAIEGRADVSVVGVMGVCYNDESMTDEEKLIVNLVTQFMSIHSYFSYYKAAEMNELIELKEDEHARIENEQQKVHVRNQIMDNCLSALKHETMYYPNRIKQLADTATESTDPVARKAMIDDIHELLSYYLEIFTLLSTCASKQVENVLFKRIPISVQQIADMAVRSFNKRKKKTGLTASITTSSVPSVKVYGDTIFLQSLVDNIISLYFEHKSNGDLHLDFDYSDKFIKFAFTDTAYRYNEDSLSQLFYVDNVKYDNAEDTLIGMQYLICRQIIREHDAYSPHRGCRIYVENIREGEGSAFVFTLPIAY